MDGGDGTAERLAGNAGAEEPVEVDYDGLPGNVMVANPREHGIDQLGNVIEPIADALDPRPCLCKQALLFGSRIQRYEANPRLQREALVRPPGKDDDLVAADTQLLSEADTGQKIAHRSGGCEQCQHASPKDRGF